MAFVIFGTDNLGWWGGKFWVRGSVTVNVVVGKVTVDGPVCKGIFSI